MTYRQFLAGFILAVVLFFFPLSAQAASSSGVTGSVLRENFQGKDFSGQKLVGTEYTSVHMENANFSGADLRGGVFNGVALEGANLHGVNFTEGIAYLSDLRSVDLSDAILTDAMMLRSIFDNANITGADFTNAVLDRPQVKKLCVNASGVNSQTGVSTRESLGCS
jgi:uncharacterized protein YjbI with pentapeptide repeats